MVQVRVTCLDPSGLAAIGWFAPTPLPPCATSAQKVAQGSITLTHDSATTCIASATAAPAWLKMLFFWVTKRTLRAAAQVDGFGRLGLANSGKNGCSRAALVNGTQLRLDSVRAPQVVPKN